MNHDFESKEWADHHQVLSDGIARLFSSIARTIVGLRGFAFTTRSTDVGSPNVESASICNQTPVRNDVE